MSLTNFLKPVIRKLKLSWKNPVVRSSGLFWMATMAANVLNWSYNIVAGRLLSKEEFAVLTVFLTLQGLVNVPASATSTTVSRYIASHLGQKRTAEYREFFKHYAGLTIVIGAVMLLAFLALSGLVADFFALPTVSVVWLFSPTLPLLYLVAFNRGVLKGQLQFKWVGTLLVVEAVTKLLFLGLAPVLGLPLLWSGVLSLPVSLLIAWLVGEFTVVKKEQELRRRIEFPKRAYLDTYAFFGQSFFASIGMTLLTSAHILLVKHFFSAEEAGVYALLALFGKIVLFGAGGLIELCIPLVAKEHAEGGTGRKAFIFLMSWVGTIAIGIVSIFVLFPTQIATLLLGEKGLLVIPYLNWYLVGVVALIGIMSLNVYSIAKKDFAPARAVTILAIGQIVLLYLLHNSLMQVVQVVSLSLFGLWLLLIMYEVIKLAKVNSASFNKSIKKISTFWRSRNQTGTVLGKLPSQIDNYAFVSEIDDAGINKPHLIGIYQDFQGNKVVAKVWRGSEVTFNALSLKNEAQALSLLNQVHHRLSISAQVRVPKLMLYKHTDQEIMVVTEFCKGKIIREAAVKTKLKAYQQALHYLAELSSGMNKIEKQSLGTRTGLQYILLFPILWLLAIKQQPALWQQFIQAGIMFVGGIPALLSNRHYSLVHRDLHFHNILYDSTKITVLDWQRAIFTYPVYEIIGTLPAEWNDLEFRRQLIVMIKSHLENSPQLTKALLANFAVHALTASNLPNGHISRYKSVLNWVVSI